LVPPSASWFVKKSEHTRQLLEYREYWGTNKRTDLLDSLKSADINRDYRVSKPSTPNRFSFRPTSVVPDYDSWPRPIDFCAEAPISGLQEMRKGALMDISKTSLEKRMKQYFDGDAKWAELTPSGLTADGGGFHASSARKKLLKTESYDASRIVRYSLYPLDSRWAYHSNVRPLWNRPRPGLAAQVWDGNRFFVVRMFAERALEHAPLMTTSLLPDYHLLRC